MGTNLVDNDEESTIRKDRPDEDVGKDPRDQAVGVVYHDGTVPVDGHECPREGPRHGGRVDEAGVGVVAEVQGREVEEVQDQEQLGPCEVAADKEHDEGEMKEVVGDKVTADGAGGVDGIDITREEVANVADLEDENGEPGGQIVSV